MNKKTDRPNTKKIIRENMDRIRAYEKAFDVKMPWADENGEVHDLPEAYPRKVNGVVRSGYRISELGREGLKKGQPVLNPILGRNNAEETKKESQFMYDMADK